MIHAGANAWMAGKDPYSIVGPGREFDQYFPLLYPFPAVLVGIPFTLVASPDAAFAAFGAGLLAWALGSQPRHRYAWFAVVTPAFIYSVRMSQWAPLMTGAALLPSFGFLLACKPTIGAALWLAYPSRRALIGALVFGLLSFVLFPAWPLKWAEVLPAGTHLRAPATIPRRAITAVCPAALAQAGGSTPGRFVGHSADTRTVRGVAAVPHSANSRTGGAPGSLVLRRGLRARRRRAGREFGRYRSHGPVDGVASLPALFDPGAGETESRHR